MSAATDHIHRLGDLQGTHGCDEQAMQRQHCEQAWKRALQNGDREALRSLRLHIADAAAHARRVPGGREQWLAWMLLRCALLLPRRRF
ncbi:Uncharacterised protein [Delftia tsuruhatensis]|uniref:hypothetical protein n=1 Tax=Delftia tsuruhatensis TaxID=180282 RepID=UPI001E77E0E4|nr:hypothetical protein [Delftia tsuruhatensis]CAB5667743.1 Uncharacterised protein [Delftia tsuruhatensis]CAC9678050.1 Uncharacterised protein [Delftia tsuruhatensis]